MSDDFDNLLPTDDLLPPLTERRCETCRYAVPMEDGPQWYECLAPLPDCVNTTFLMLPHQGTLCPCWSGA